MRGELTRDIEIRPSSVALWSGILLPPFAWAAHLQLKYALVQYVCWNRAPWILWTIAGGALLLCLFAAFCAWRGWQAAIAEGAVPLRAALMGWGGLALSFAFAITIIATAIGDLFLRACD